MYKLPSILFFFFIIIYPYYLKADPALLDLPDDYINLPENEKWKAKPIAFYKDHLNTPIIAFLIDKDDDLQLNFISYLKKVNNENWNGCSPFIINAMSKKYDVFLDNEVILNLMASVQNYSDAFCPNGTKILFFASPKPFGMPGVDLPVISKTDENIFFAAKLEKNQNGNWSFSPENVINRVQNVIEDQQNNLVILNNLYQKLQSASPSQKAAFFFDENDLDNPFLMLKAAQITNSPVKTVFIAHVKHLENSNGWIDIPFPISFNDLSKNIKQKGWYIIKGKISPLNAKEKIKAGIKKKSPAAFLKIENSFKCENQSCEETNDLISLIQTKFKIYDWKPYQ